MTILLQLHRILSFYIITLVYSTVLHKTNGFFPKSQNKYILKSNNVLCKVAAIFFFLPLPFPKHPRRSSHFLRTTLLKHSHC